MPFFFNARLPQRCIFSFALLFYTGRILLKGDNIVRIWHMHTPLAGMTRACGAVLQRSTSLCAVPAQFYGLCLLSHPKPCLALQCYPRHVQILTMTDSHPASNVENILCLVTI